MIFLGLVLYLAITVGIGLFAAGCSKTFSDKDVHWLSIVEAQEAMDANSDSWFSKKKQSAWIDPRDAVFYRVGHVPGAINVLLSDPDAITRLEGFGTLIVYGAGYEAPIADAMIKALLTETEPLAGVMHTNPATPPEHAPRIVGRLMISHSMPAQAMTPAAAAT